jgi:hypothetical protein
MEHICTIVFTRIINILANREHNKKTIKLD